MFLKTIKAVVLVSVLGGLGVLPLTAAIVDNFDSYATGPLSVVSGGQWGTWHGNSTDAVIAAGGLSAPNAMYHDGLNIPDVVRYTGGSLLRGLGDVARLSFDLYAHEAGSEDIFTAFVFGTGDPQTNDIDYDSAVSRVFIDRYNDAVGRVTVYIWDQDGLLHGGDYGLPELVADWSVDTWHHVELVVTQAVPDMTANDPAEADGYFDVLLDGVTAATQLPFGLDNPLGLNAIEIWSKYGNAGDDYFLYDNITLVGPPLKGDLNCDDVVGFADINPFVTALLFPDEYAQTYPNCDILNGDLNSDGQANFADINPFVDLLMGLP